MILSRLLSGCCALIGVSLLIWGFVYLPADQVARGQGMESRELTQPFVGQGFDACNLPSASDMQAWWQGSPYRVVNLYGGPLHACHEGQATRQRVQELMQQGWKFIPTWVGPQSQCWAIVSSAAAARNVVVASNGSSARRIEQQVELAYAQGVSEANAAIEWATNLGLTDADGADTILYYNLEHFDESPQGNQEGGSCIEASQAFVNGWSAQIQERNNLAGLYTTACTFSRYVNTTPALNAVWIARYLIPYQYRADASVFGLPCIGDDVWSEHQRIVQYAGGHDETWNDVTLNIDSNVIDGIVALGNLALIATPTNTPEKDTEKTPEATPNDSATATPIATAPATTENIYLPLVQR